MSALQAVKIKKGPASTLYAISVSFQSVHLPLYARPALGADQGWYQTATHLSR